MRFFYISPSEVLRNSLLKTWVESDFDKNSNKLLEHLKPQTGIHLGTLEIVLKEVLWSIWDLIRQYEVSLPRTWNDILILDQLQWHPLPISFSINFMTLIPNLTFTELRVVSMKRLQRVWHASRARLPFRSLVPSHILELVYAPIVETSFPELAVSFLDFSPSIPLGTPSMLFWGFYYFNPEILYFAPISLGIIAYRFLRLFKTTPTDRVKSVCNRCVIEFLVAFLYCHVAFCIFLWL